MVRPLRLLTALFTAAVMACGLAVTTADQAHAASFTYSYANPFDAGAQTYIHSTSNIQLYSEGTVRVWTPITGGTTFANTTPGVITYKFDFGTDVVDSAFLRTNNPTVHWSYSRGHNFFFGSKDGVVWEQLLNVPPPAFGSANGGFYNQLLPASLLGGTQLWFKAELYSYGSSAPNGGFGTNTAQHSRWDTGQGSSAETFKLEVDFKKPDDPSVIPLPAALPILSSGLAVFGLIGWRRRQIG